jgi:hypothetical protein
MKKQKDLLTAFSHWRANVNQLALDEQRSEIVTRLVTKSLTTVGKIIERASQASLSCAFRAIFELKS